MLLAWIRPLTLPDEGRYGGVAWNMLTDHSYLTPLLDGMPYFHKPPLYYWLAQLSFSVFGPNAWAARVPSVLAAWATIAACYAFCARYRSRALAARISLTLATLPLFYGAAQYANLDMLVASFITLTVLAAAHAVASARAGTPRRWASIATGALAGFAVLAKGLIGIALPGLIVLLWILSLRDWRRIGLFLRIPELAALIIVAVPWFAWMQHLYPGFFHYMVVYQQFDRFSEGGFNNVRPFWFYVPILLGFSVPWSLWCWRLFTRSFWTTQPAQADNENSTSMKRLMAIWLLVILGFFSIPSSKLIGYILPALPPLAFLINDIIENRPARKLVRWTAGAAALLCVVAVGLSAHRVPKNSKWMADWLGPRMQAGDVVVLGDNFPFDLALQLHRTINFEVLENWDDPAIPTRDDWRKELYDAAGFNPTLGKQLLVTGPSLREQFCQAPPSRRYWVIAASYRLPPGSFLSQVQPMAQIHRYSVWLVSNQGDVRQTVCGETPMPGSPGTSAPPQQ